MRLGTRVLVCCAALAALVLMAVPGSRSFASELAAKIVHLRPGGAGGPIPFILDLNKHKRPPKTPAARPTSGKNERSPATRPR